jgi:hypothetical protein
MLAAGGVEATKMLQFVMSRLYVAGDQVSEVKRLPGLKSVMLAYLKTKVRERELTLKNTDA